MQKIRRRRHQQNPKREQSYQSKEHNSSFFAFAEKNNGDKGDNGYFSYSKINQLKDSHITKGEKKGKKHPYSHYDHYEITENKEASAQGLNQRKVRDMRNGSGCQDFFFSYPSIVTDLLFYFLYNCIILSAPELSYIPQARITHAI